MIFKAIFPFQQIMSHLKIRQELLCISFCSVFLHRTPVAEIKISEVYL